jgi:N6-L-threonylcarbamoyladenine synthase
MSDTKNTFPTARILAIESSCDETAAAVLENGRVLLSSVVASQIDLHQQYGGVFPEVASRQHILTIYDVVEQALQQAYLSLDNIDAIAVTRGPGLAGSLVVGMNMAKGIALGKDIPLIGVNHLEGHIYSAWVYSNEIQIPPPIPEFPLIALLVSGGHTEINLMDGHLSYKRLGSTLDDAAGEAFDKVARLLDLPYPGGPSIQKAAVNGNPSAFKFLAASFQQAVVDVLFQKTIQAAKQHKVKNIVVAGGVSANQLLRDTFMSQSNFNIFIPPLKYCTDNAAMIAAAGYFRFINDIVDPLDIDVLPNWPLS